MTILNFKDFMKKYKLKNDTMNESEIQKNYNHKYTPETLKFIQIKDLLTQTMAVWVMGGSHWTCFIVKDNKSYYFDSFGGQSHKFLLNQLTKPIIYHIYKIQDINSKLCGSYCLYSFYLIERMN